MYLLKLNIRALRRVNKGAVQAHEIYLGSLMNVADTQNAFGIL
jgi:hypothetical protein